MNPMALGARAAAAAMTAKDLMLREWKVLLESGLRYWAERKGGMISDDQLSGLSRRRSLKNTFHDCLCTFYRPIQLPLPPGL